jgi:hypothetical protein
MRPGKIKFDGKGSPEEVKTAAAEKKRKERGFEKGKGKLK